MMFQHNDILVQVYVQRQVKTKRKRLLGFQQCVLSAIQGKNHGCVTQALLCTDGPNINFQHLYSKCCWVSPLSDMLKSCWQLGKQY